MNIYKNLRNIQLSLMNGIVYAQTTGAYSTENGDSEDAIAEIQDNIKRIMIADTEEDFLTVVVELLNLAIKFVGILAVAFLIWGGIKYIISGGDESKTEEANKTIINALVGLGIVLLSGVIVNFVIETIAN